MIPFHYKCTECGRTFERDEVRYLCLDCGKNWSHGEPLRGVLEVEFALNHLKQVVQRKSFSPRQLLPIEQRFQFEFTHGNTPLVTTRRLGEKLGYQSLWVKNDGLNPTGSLKDRASYLVVAEALRLGEKSVVTASTGNAASALAATVAAAGLQAIIFVPSSAPPAKLTQMLICGATVIPVDGDYDDAFRLSIEYTQQCRGLNRNTAYNPLTIEGKKSAGLEIFQQLSPRFPDVIVIPVGDGVILHSVAKACSDLLHGGLIERLPRLIGVQANGSQAIHKLCQTGQFRSLKSTTTIADSIAVRVPSNAYCACTAIKNTNGFTITVSDHEILLAQQVLAKTEGIFAEPAAASVIAALRKSEFKLRVSDSSNIVALITGHGLKDVPSALSKLVMPKPIQPVLSALPNSLLRITRR